jgi:hypothetical protein
MEHLTTQVEKLSVKEGKVLYYSVKFPDYDFIVTLVKKTLFEDGSEGGVYNKFQDEKVFEYGTLNEVKVDEKYLEFVKKLKSGENFVIYKGKFYVVNSEFHITTLYTGGKPHEKSEAMEEQTDKAVSVFVNKLGVSDGFITLGVDRITLSNSNDIEYYGNDVKHITFGLAKFGKKVFPKDSYTSLTTGETFELHTKIQAVTGKVVQ